MSTWVSIISKFTSELLVFIAFGFFALLTLYFSFWILKKRRYGSVDQSVPSGVVKNHLNQLLQDAQTLRNQLFGILSDTGVIPQQTATVGAISPALEATQAETPAAAGSPELAGQLDEFQKKLNQQAQAIQMLEEEKKKLTEALNAAKSSGATADSSSDSELKSKVKELEERLAEYSVIEDDLANLKKLQQENEKLKAKIGGDAPETEVAAEESKEEPAAEAKAEDTPAEESKEETAEASSATKAEGFDDLVDKVEESLQVSEEPAAETKADEAPAEENKEETAEAKTQDAAPEESKEEPVAEAKAEDTPAEENKEETAEAKTQDAAPEESKEEPAAEAKADEAPAEEKKEEKKEASAPAEEGSSDEDLLSEFEKMLNI